MTVWFAGWNGTHSTLHTSQSSTKSDKYSYFFWWWAHSCLKHVQKRNKHIEKNCAPSWLYLQDPRVYLHSHCREKHKPYLQTVFVVSFEPESYSAPITSISTEGLEIPRPDLLRCLAPITRIDKVSGSTPTKVFLSYGSKSSLDMNCGFMR